MYPNKVYIALGTNLGNWKNNFNQALKFISKLGTIDKIGSIYLSKPYGFDNQNYFYNTAIEFSTSLSPHFLQISLQLIEKKMKKNKKITNGPRNIDLDIIFYNRKIINQKKLNVPHISCHKRDFVMLPIIEINHFAYHPVLKKTLIELMKLLDEKFVIKIMRHGAKSLTIY